MVQGERQYEAIVFGATGYTGKYTAEHVTISLPTDFKWAIAGRSEDKLKTLASELKSLNPNRTPPRIETAQLVKSDLVNLAQKTKVLITTVGPYHKYGTAVVEACAETGTHYLDVTGETPWVYEIIQRYHETAKKSGAIMIPQNGIESAPSDLMCWALVSYIRKTLGTGTGEIVHSIHDMKASASGGTLATVLSLFDTYGLSDLAMSGGWSMCTVKPPQQQRGKPLLEKLTGLRNESDLGGVLTDSLQGAADIPIVYRSWSLYDGGKFYGSNFFLSPYMRAKSALTGLAVHFGMAIGFMALILPPVRWLLKQFAFQPGQGPTKEQVKSEFVEWRAIAHADVSDPRDPKRAMGRMRFDGSMYHLTGILLAEAAVTIARSETPAHGLGGGILTPATLGETYLERLQKAGLETEIRMMA